MKDFNELVVLVQDAARNPRLTSSEFNKICELADEKIGQAWFNDLIDMDTCHELRSKIMDIKFNKNHPHSHSNRSFNRNSSHSNQMHLIQQEQFRLFNEQVQLNVQLQNQQFMQNQNFNFM